MDRRKFMGAMALAGGVGMAGRAIAAPTVTPLAELKKEGDTACLYHCDFGAKPRFDQMLSNISNHYSAYGADPFALQLAIVAHGPGVKFFMESLASTPWKEEEDALTSFQRVESLAQSGLKVYLCNITFQNLKLDREAVRKAEFVRFVPSGVATVGDLQAKGFSYLKIG